jgi:hypothetical protein
VKVTKVALGCLQVVLSGLVLGYVQLQLQRMPNLPKPLGKRIAAPNKTGFFTDLNLSLYEFEIILLNQHFNNNNSRLKPAI